MGRTFVVIFSQEPGRWVDYVHTITKHRLSTITQTGMRGQGEPPGWEDRFDIDRERWSENWLLYERDLMIQKDMEWLAEAVFKFYRKASRQVDQRNDKLWRDFCQKKFDDDGNEVGLEIEHLWI